MSKNKEILEHQKKQNTLKTQVKEIKRKLPTYIIGFLLFAFVSLYFLENTFYNYFGKNVNLIIIIVVILSVFSLFILIRSYLKVKQLQRESKSIGSKLYKLMKLETETKDE
ncbi:hypothetical protein [Polaribacter septentrionalilitoris]|uniref:hypothetical protein n=1 Tax=Polaribacter septentrionalilitoris TaxID=2494657 RepID=UPI00135AE639|nr:hypothetical protein [Polaribacter septentrionalilitoris]